LFTGKEKKRGPFRNGGFTMMEIIAVLLVIGIVAAVVVSRMGDTGNFDLASQLEVLKGHLRYAQSRAMSSNSVWGINITSTTTYYLFEGAGSTTPVHILGEDNATVSLTAKKSALTISSAPQRITFDGYGSPGTTTLTVATNGGNITVTKNTGFIP
jgi:prepilin-type N-terminal cleavage/methylation domain-containing protein